MIGLFNDCFPPIMDGVSVATSNYAYWLDKKGEDVCVITPTAASYTDNEAYPIYRYVSMPIPMRKPYRMGFPRIDWPFHRQIDSIDFDLLHAHCPFSSGQLAMSIAHDRHVPLVATFHSKYRSDFERIIPSKFIINQMIGRIVSFYEKADEVWIPQASVEETLREYGYKGRVEVVDNGNDFAGTYDEAERVEARKALGVRNDEILLLFVGQHIWEKNLRFLLQAVSQISGLPFRMFFVGTGYAADELKELSRSLGLEGKVHFVGSITERYQIRKYYLAADLFLFPSLYDNAPLVVREAAALHTPSLMIEGSTAAAIITDGHNGFLSSASTSEYADRIKAVCRDRKLLDRVGREAASTLARSWEDIMGEVIDRYHCIIKRYHA